MIEQLKEWNKMIGEDIADYPKLLSKELAILKIKLLREEVQELADAFETNNLVEALDAICDIEYVLSGIVVSMGLESVINKALNEVHNSNMSKFPNCETDAKLSVEKLEQKGIDANYTFNSELSKYVIRRYDGKIQKGINFKKPDFKRLLNVPKT